MSASESFMALKRDSSLGSSWGEGWEIETGTLLMLTLTMRKTSSLLGPILSPKGDDSWKGGLVVDGRSEFCEFARLPDRRREERWDLYGADGTLWGGAVTSI